MNGQGIEIHSKTIAGDFPVFQTHPKMCHLLGAPFSLADQWLVIYLSPMKS